MGFLFLGKYLIAQPASDLKVMGVHMIAIGVTEEANNEELNIMASSTADVLNMVDYDELLKKVGEITKIACSTTAGKGNALLHPSYNPTLNRRETLWDLPNQYTKLANGLRSFYISTQFETSRKNNIFYVRDIEIQKKNGILGGDTHSNPLSKWVNDLLDVINLSREDHDLDIHLYHPIPNTRCDYQQIYPQL